MDEAKTRILPRDAASAPAAAVEPRVADGKIVFHCPAGHRLTVPVALAGKHGTCSKCGVPLQIPSPSVAADSTPATADAGIPQVSAAPDPSPAADAAPAAATVPRHADEGDWNFISDPVPALQDAVPDGSEWSPPEAVPTAVGQGNAMARLLARLWAERDHGGIIELHLAGGAVILPEEFSWQWSAGSHGVFASQAADGSVTLTAVAWDTVQRIVVRHLTAVPGDMFE